MRLSAPAGSLQTIALGALAAGLALTVGTALGFQHLAGYIPCALCLEQRTPYYLASPLLLAGLAAALLRAPAIAVRGALLAGAALMAWSLYLAGFHAGVEWGWWLGPVDCGVVVAPTSGGDLLGMLDAVVPPSCDEAAGRFLGLSFAGWNFVASLVFALAAGRAALTRRTAL